MVGVRLGIGSNLMRCRVGRRVLGGCMGKRRGCAVVGGLGRGRFLACRMTLLLAFGWSVGLVCRVGDETR